MARTPQLLDRWGNPVQRAQLIADTGPPSMTGFRSPVSGYPGDGLTPIKLAQILRHADHGNPVQYLELAETIEERDPHYIGVLGTRRRSVAQVEISVDAASDAPEDVARADLVREWLKRDELQQEMFDILDCLGKGYSFTRIDWDTSEGQWWPKALKREDPRWFRFDRRDLATPLKIADDGTEQPLDPFRYIFATIQAKSGLPLRGGLARVAAWGWMFKQYTLRDWAIFTQTFGQPVRVGKYGKGASEQEKETLFRAVTNIAGDCAAIIPEGMVMEFVETKNVGASSDLYLKRADWLDQQISKAVLGQTGTTDSVTSGLGSGAEHRQVQEDIERSDAKALSAIINRDLIRPWMQLEFGFIKGLPRIRIERPESEDITTAANALGVLVPLGLRVSMSEVRDKFGWSDPKAGDDVLAVLPASPPAAALPGGPLDPNPIIKREPDKFKRVEGDLGITAAPQSERPSAAIFPGGDPVDDLADQLAIEARPAMAAMLSQVEAMIEAAGSLEELREMLLTGYPELDAEGLAEVIAIAMIAGHAGGRAVVAEDTRG